MPTAISVTAAKTFVPRPSQGRFGKIVQPNRASIASKTNSPVKIRAARYSPRSSTVHAHVITKADAPKPRIRKPGWRCLKVAWMALNKLEGFAGDNTSKDWLSLRDSWLDPNTRYPLSDGIEDRPQCRPHPTLRQMHNHQLFHGFAPMCHENFTKRWKLSLTGHVLIV